MFVLQMRRYHAAWIVTCRGSFEMCQRMMFRWIVLGYDGETQITAAR
jgi:hypothetical protein